MPRKSLDDLRAEIIAESRELQQIIDRRDDLKAEYDSLNGAVRRVTKARDRHIQSAKRAGGSTDQLAADAGLTPARIRQIAPGPRPTKAPRAATSPAAAPAPATVRVAAAVPEDLQLHCGQCGIEHAPEDCDHRAQPTGTATAPATIRRPAAAAAEVRDTVRSVREQLHDAAGPNGVLRVPAGRLLPPARTTPVAAAAGGKTSGRKHLPDLDAPFSIDARVDQALQLHGGDIAAATAALIAGAVQDAMKLLALTRKDGRYDYTAHPSLPAPLIKPDRKHPDMIWEGRPRYVNGATPAGTVVDALDVNGAYLSALRRVHLPIGRLIEDAPGAPFDRRRSGIYLIEPGEWTDPTLPNPLGDGRESTGPVWVTDSTVRLMIRAAANVAVSRGTRPAYRGPRILQSHTSGNSESLLTKFGDVLAGARAGAIERGDSVTLDYVKALYSRFVSTAGESKANHEIFRPEWVHAIRSQAYANLWYKAEKARDAGLTVHRMTGTDELHLVGDWAAAVAGDRLVFPEGRGLAQVKRKETYVVGDER